MEGGPTLYFVLNSPMYFATYSRKLTLRMFLYFHAKLITLTFLLILAIIGGLMFMFGVFGEKTTTVDVYHQDTDLIIRRCPKLKINSAIYQSNFYNPAECQKDVTSRVQQLCENKTNDQCSFTVTNEMFQSERCLKRYSKQLVVNYTCKYRTRNNRRRCTLCATSSHTRSCQSCTGVEKYENEQKCSISCECRTIGGDFQTSNATWYNNCELWNSNGELKCASDLKDRCPDKTIMHNMNFINNCTCNGVLLLDGFDYPGRDIYEIGNISLQQCFDNCTKTSNCIGFAFDPFGSQCWTKWKLENLRYPTDYIRTTGIVIERLGFDMIRNNSNGDIPTQQSSRSIKTVYIKEGEEYHGQVNASGSLVGYGLYLWKNGDMYLGQFTSGVQTGRGTMVYNDKNKYVGDFVDGDRHGNGTMIWANNDKYDGNWVNGNIEGNGTKIWSNGDEYEGQWEDDMRNGYGVFKESNGDTYRGNWVNDRKQGRGTMTYSNGSILETTWAADDPYPMSH
ncbi:unnamed protein product [Adineta ricciae]|uniref:Apple domain-containing protein n=1 Tax=Adineta ricciae TaxID=249248 RepID=A0A814VZL7_ADIRI|nr:unnamed protein product [Adineta ricciae]